MSHRDVSISLLGLVVGIVLGAGALSYAQHVSLQASVSGSDVAMATFHGAADPLDYTRRGINTRGVPLRPEGATNLFPTVKPAQNTSSSAAPVMAVDSFCDVAQKTVEKMKTVYNNVIPTNVKNTEIRQRMDAAFVSAVNDYCMPAGAMSSSAMSSSSAGAVMKTDNNCGKYPRHTLRYTQCVIADENGARYP